jgi:hypothetical protein
LRRDDADLHAAGQRGRLFLTPAASKSRVAAIGGILDRVKTKLAHVPMRTGAALALAALSTVVGCGSDALPFSELQSSVLAATCRYDVRCQNYPDQATCLASVQTQPHFFDTMEVDIASGKVIYDGVSARACVDRVNGVSSCTRDVYKIASSSMASCNKAFTGTVAVGGTCFFSEECVGGGACLTTGNCDSFYQCCAGTCQAPFVSVPVGGDCAAYGSSACPPGSACIADATSGKTTCRAPLSAGASCSISLSCAVGLFCDLATTQTCEPLIRTGGTCNPALGSADCIGPQDVCDSTTSVCKPPLAVGSPCVGSSQSCVSYASCDTTTGTCVERPVVGASCNPTYGPSCLGGNCDATTMACTLPVSAGACS